MHSNHLCIRKLSVPLWWVTFVGEAETLIHFKLFPSTLKQPTVGFSFQILDYLQAHFLEFQVVVSDFTAAMKTLSVSPFIKVNNMEVYCGLN